MNFRKIAFGPWRLPGAPMDSSERDREFSWLTLNFRKDLEREFRRDLARKSIWLFRLGIGIAFVLWAGFGLLDNWIVPEVKGGVWFIRYAIVLPFLILVFLFTYSRYFVRYMQVAAAAVYLNSVFSLIAMVDFVIRPVGAHPYTAGLLLALPCACVVFRLRFLNALWAGLAIVLVDNAAAIWLTEIPAVIIVNNNFFNVSSIVLGLVAGYNMEVYNRRDFLLRRAAENAVKQLETANLAKSRFLAAASHDLRQPLHALGLFVAQLRGRVKAAERDRIVERIDASVAAMNELFNELLDIAKLDAGVLAPNRAEFPIAHLLQRIETNFAGPARDKALRLRVLPSTAWIRSDPILLERILLNLVSNAVRYTSRGGVLVGCRQRDGMLRIEVVDTGPGIPADQQLEVFGEFYQLAGFERDRHGGLGLGLAIVDRLCRLLDHPIELTSMVGHGSRFAVSVPAVAPRARVVAPVPSIVPDALSGKLVVVVDDDALVREGMGGLLRAWGCNVVTAPSEGAAMVGLAKRRPDLIVCDYRLANGVTGFDVIARLRRSCGATVPAFLISGDTAPERLREARVSGYHLLHKPVQPAALRAMLGRLLKKEAARAAAVEIVKS
jgi:signal transduction histidine kinase/CheY-like chemotaxis protein